MTKQKKHWYDFLFRPVEVDGGPVHIKKVPAIILLLIVAGLLTVGYFAFCKWMAAPVDVRAHKAQQIRNIRR
jgi:hypothetical protein